MDPDHHYLIVARQEYTSVLVDLLYRPLYVGIKSIWDDAKENYPRSEVYGRFQDKLLKIPRWNQTVITTEHRRIVDKTKCDYLDNLIRKVFVLHTQLLAATSSQPNRKVSLSVPRTDNFIHKCYEMCGRAFFENPYLMEDRPGTFDTRKRVRNLQESNAIIKDGICTTIRTLLPVSNLLQEDEETVEQQAPPPPSPARRPSASPGPSRPVTPPARDEEEESAIPPNRWEPIMPRTTKKEKPTAQPEPKEDAELLKVYFTNTQSNNRDDADTESAESHPIQSTRDADPISIFEKGIPEEKADLDVDSDEVSVRSTSRKDAEPFFDSDEE